MTATLFTITEAGRLVGLGMICLEARYASVRWAGADRLARCSVTGAQWQAIQRALKAGLAPKPVARPDVFANVLTGERLGLDVQWIAGLPVPAGHGPGAMAGVLDRLLLSQATQGPGTLLSEADGQDPDSRKE